MKKPTANTAEVFSNCAVGSPLGKKEAEKYSDSAEYAYQSYHSTRLPADPPMMACSRFASSAMRLSPPGTRGEITTGCKTGG